MVSGAYPDIERALGNTAEAIRRLEQWARRRPKLDPERLRQRTSAGSAPDGDAEAAAALREGLGDFQIEVATLEAQAKRALESGAHLIRALKPLCGEEPPAQTVSSSRDVPASSDALAEENAALRAEAARLRREIIEAQARPTPLKAATEPSLREHDLEAEVERLRAKLAELHHDLAHVREAPAALPADVQEELATLRVEAAALRETNERLRRPLPGSSDERFDVIASQAFDPEGRRKLLGQILVDAGVIRNEHLEIALYEQHSSWRRHLGAILVDLGFASEEDIAHALAAQLALPFIDLRMEHVSEQALALVSRQLAIHHTCIPLRINTAGITIAFANPHDLVALDDLRLATGRPVQPVVATAGQIKYAIREHYLI
ncbi:MAG TPA: hypothetical protein PKI11_04080 [Candidatus Hydrogenedentes bacterium]|nr:hypothetical protein [Candidatus Hydrogenedentota bacterium]